jgi:hypothetical protein
MADPSTPPTTAAYIDYKTLTIAGDATAACHSGRRIRAKCGTARMHGTVASSVYFGGFTTVTLTEASDDLTSDLTGLWVGTISGPGGDSSLPVHPHDSENAGGDSIAADLDCGEWA